MFLIYKDGEIVERAETLRYILQQDNGVAVISTQESYNAVYSPATDKTYPIGEFFVEEEDEAAALGVFLHGRAGAAAACKKGEHSVLARDIADCLLEKID